MNHSDVIRKIEDMANVGEVLSADEAISVLAAMVDQLDKQGELYDLDVAALVKVGATIRLLSKGSRGTGDIGFAPKDFRP